MLNLKETQTTRLEVTIPDQLYGQAQQVASETGVSFGRFIVEAVQLHVQDESEEPVRLTREQVAVIRRGLADIKAGKGMTLDQVEVELAENRAAWRIATRARSYSFPANGSLKTVFIKGLVSLAEAWLRGKRGGMAASLQNCVALLTDSPLNGESFACQLG